MKTCIPTFSPKQAILHCTAKFRLHFLSIQGQFNLLQFIICMHFILFNKWHQDFKRFQKGPELGSAPQADKQHFLKVRHLLSLIISWKDSPCDAFSKSTTYVV